MKPMSLLEIVVLFLVNGRVVKRYPPCGRAEVFPPVKILEIEYLQESGVRKTYGLVERVGPDRYEILGNDSPGDGFDVVADASGNERGIDAGLRAIRKGGHYVQVGLTGRPISLDIDLICLKELVVTSGFASTPRSWHRVEQLIASGAVVLDPLVTDIAPLSAWETSFERTRRADGVKLVLDPRMDA